MLPFFLAYLHLSATHVVQDAPTYRAHSQHPLTIPCQTRVSAHTYLLGPFDFNRMHLTPIVCAVQCHEKPTNQGTWAEHTIDGWLLRSAQDCYRAFHCYIKAMRASQVCDTLQFMHKHITQPALTPGDTNTKVAHALTHALKVARDWLDNK